MCDRPIGYLVGVGKTLPEGWKPRTAALDAPGASLQRVEGPRGEVGLAIRFRADLADHPLLQKGMDEVAPFVRDPGVKGVLPLAAWDPSQALFIYTIGEGRLLSEILIRCGARGVVPGERVAIELLERVAAILDDASAAGRRVNIANHGALNPWRIVVYPTGRVALVGYALPPIEVLAWLDEDTDALPGSGFRYSPPERIQDGDEDVRSDLFALGIMASELALGSILLAGTPQQLVDLILSDEPIAPPRRAVRARPRSPRAHPRPRQQRAPPDRRGGCRARQRPAPVLERSHPRRPRERRLQRGRPRRQPVPLRPSPRHPRRPPPRPRGRPRQAPPASHSPGPRAPSPP